LQEPRAPGADHVLHFVIALRAAVNERRGVSERIGDRLEPSARGREEAVHPAVAEDHARLGAEDELPSVLVEGPVVAPLRRAAARGAALENLPASLATDHHEPAVAGGVDVRAVVVVPPGPQGRRVPAATRVAAPQRERRTAPWDRDVRALPEEVTVDDADVLH